MYSHTERTDNVPTAEDAICVVMDWRNRELSQIIYQRDGACWIPDCDGDGFRSDMHEAIIARRDVMGFMPKERRLAIFNGLNTIYLCQTVHHLPSFKPAREEIAAFMADLYGLDVVLDWLESLEFKGRHPLAGWMEAHQ